MLAKLNLGGSNVSRYETEAPLAKGKFDVYMELIELLTCTCNDNVILQGNVMLNYITECDTRMTMDMDITVLSHSVLKSKVIPLIGEFFYSDRFGRLNTTVKVNNDDSYSVKVLDDDGVCQFSLDIVVEHSKFVGLSEYMYRDIRFSGSSIERMIADKCSALLGNNRPYSRAKDLYDLYRISMIDYCVNSEALLECFTCDRTAEQLAVLLGNFPFSMERADKFRHAYNSLKLYSTNTGRRINPQPKFELAMEAFNTYCEIIIDGVYNNEIL